MYVLLPLDFSDKDLEDMLGGGDYKPDKNKGRNIETCKLGSGSSGYYVANRSIEPFLASRK